MSKSVKFLIYVLISLYISLNLTGCASVLAPAEIKPINPKTARNWEMQGKISVRMPHQAQTANINWRQDYQNYSIKIFGPLGIGAVRFEGSKNHIELIDNQGKSHTARSAEGLSQQILGYPLPIENLIYWLKGRKTRKSYGWEIKYLAYEPNGLPKLLEAHQKDIYIRIFIEKWQFF